MKSPKLAEEIGELVTRLALAELSWNSDTLDFRLRDINGKCLVAKGSMPEKDWSFEYRLYQDKIWLLIYHAIDKLDLDFKRSDTGDIPMLTSLLVNLELSFSNASETIRKFAEEIRSLYLAPADIGGVPRGEERRTASPATLDTRKEEQEVKLLFCYRMLKTVEDYIRATAPAFFGIADRYFSGYNQPKIGDQTLATRSHLDIIAEIK